MKQLRKRINTDSVMCAARDAGKTVALKEGMESLFINNRCPYQ